MSMQKLDGYVFLDVPPSLTLSLSLSLSLSRCMHDSLHAYNLVQIPFQLSHICI